MQLALKNVPTFFGGGRNWGYGDGEEYNFQCQGV